jgi:predicted metal-binding membrane protein
LSSTPDRGADLAAGADRRLLTLGLIGALSAGAWVALAAWSASPYGRYLDHGSWTDPAWVVALCRSFPQGQLVVPALLYAGAWLLMILAMMLPTTLPLLGVFSRVTAARADRDVLMVLCLLGYLAAWGGFGLLAYLADSAVHFAAARSGWLTAHGWAIGALVLAGAGAFQFSELKYRCLERCRTPFGFVNARWRGRAPGREAFRVGFDHGVFCVGCCWALMLVMFVVGMGNLGWMLVLAALMAAEKNLPVGRQLAPVLGAVLLGWAGLTLLANLG